MEKYRGTYRIRSRILPKDRVSTRGVDTAVRDSQPVSSPSGSVQSPCTASIRRVLAPA